MEFNPLLNQIGAQPPYETGFHIKRQFLILMTRPESLDWQSAFRDVFPFIEYKHEIDLLTPDNFQRLLRGKAG